MPRKRLKKINPPRRLKVTVTLKAVTNFLSHVKEVPSPKDLFDCCWEWQGYKDANGYGWLHDQRTSVGAHRYAYALFVGTLPEGYTVDHKCHNTSCVNPNHLARATIKWNSADGGRRSSTKKPRDDIPF